MSSYCDKCGRLFPEKELHKTIIEDNLIKYYCWQCGLKIKEEK